MDGYGFEERSSSAMQKQLIELALNPLGVVRRRWIWMTLALVVGLAATGAVVVNLEPVYRATSTVLVSSQQIPEDFVKSTVQGLDSLSNVNALVGEVLSQRNLSQLIQKYDLYAESRGGRPPSEMAQRMRGNIEIEPQRNVSSGRRGEASSIFVISYEGESPSAVANVANSLASILIAASLDKRSEQARRTTEFLRRELDRIESKLAEANRAIGDFNREYRGELPSDMQPLLNKLERLQQQRQTTIERISAAEDRLVALETADGTSDVMDLLMDMKLSLSHQAAIHTDEHPNVISLRRRIERLEAEVAATEAEGTDSDGVEQHGMQIAETKGEIDLLRDRLQTTEEQIAEIEARVDRIPSRTEEFASLELRAAVLRENHLEFLRKVKDAELAETLESAQQGPQVSLLDQARPPRGPTQSPLMFLIPGILASFGLALAVGIGLELIDPVILSPTHLDAVGSPPLLGSVYRLS